jgi:hypothetical protein
MALRTSSCPKVLTKEWTIRRKTFKDVSEEDEVKTGDHLNMVL